jgi:hypothetical protein
MTYKVVITIQALVAYILLIFFEKIVQKIFKISVVKFHVPLLSPNS